MSFADLKKRRNNLEKLTEAAEKLNGTKSYTDDRIWNVSRDKAGNGYAVIRFLPAPEGQEIPWNQYWDHGFKGPNGQWYIENSLSSIGKEDPVSKLNSEMWNNPSKFGMDEEEAKKVVRDRKRRLHYVANVFVISDPANPDNEGKVMIYKFGKKIFDKIMDAMKPQYEDEKPLDPFDMWTGANFKIKVRNVENWVNYDKSEFDSPSKLSEDDDELEKIYNQLYDLSEFTDPAKYKTYNELQARLNTVLGYEQEDDSSTDEDLPREEPKKIKSAPASELASDEYDPDIDSDDDDDTDDVLAQFARLAAGD